MPHFFTRAERAELAKKGEARSDGSYPIRNAQDLANAAKDYNRTGQDPAVKAWIGKRAKQLGLPNPLEQESPAEDKGENEGRESYDSVIAKHAARIK